jgi:hypothetical protein
MTIAYFKLIYGFWWKGNNSIINHRIGDVVCMKEDNSVWIYNIGLYIW